MAKSTKALLTGRIQKCKTNPSIAHIGLATHGRSIQIGSSHPDPVMKAKIIDLQDKFRDAFTGWLEIEEAA